MLSWHAQSVAAARAPWAKRSGGIRTLQSYRVTVLSLPTGALEDLLDILLAHRSGAN